MSPKMTLLKLTVILTLVNSNLLQISNSFETRVKNLPKDSCFIYTEAQHSMIDETTKRTTDSDAVKLVGDQRVLIGRSNATNSDSGENSQEDASRHKPITMPWFHKFSHPSMISNEPNFIAGKWSECSVSCGKGIRKRAVECKIFLEFSRTIARLPESQCSGHKPSSIESCNAGTCNYRTNLEDSREDDMNNDNSNSEEDDQNEIINSGVDMPINKMIPLSKISTELRHYWKNSGFTECSASCLGGTQESIIHCVRSDNNSVVNPYLCDINKKPESFTRTCNSHACPPRWNLTDFGVCSKQCGGGVQTREIQCVHEVTRGITNTVVVSNHHCQQPMPRTKQFCNVFDCTPQWAPQSWSKCSRSCGGGVKTRKLKCIKELAFSQVVEQTASKCPLKRPKVIKACNYKPCRNPMSELRRQIYQINKFSKQNDNKFGEYNEKRRTISLKVSGEALVRQSTLIRLRCPRYKNDKNSNHTQWYKNDAKIITGTRIKTIGRNILRIKNISYLDAGIYTCTWDNKTMYSLNLKITNNDIMAVDDEKIADKPNFDNRIDATHQNDDNHYTNNKDIMSFLNRIKSIPKQEAN